MPTLFCSLYQVKLYTKSRATRIKSVGIIKFYLANNV